MNTFTFVFGPLAGGKTTFMENKLYNTNKYECNFFDHDKLKLMVKLYANDKSKINVINLGDALKNAIHDCIKYNKDFMIQIQFTSEQLNQIDIYLHEYKDKFVFNAHFIAVGDVEILRERAKKRELLGGYLPEEQLIRKSFIHSFENFYTYLPKFKNAFIWDNSKDFGFNNMEKQLMFMNGKLTFQNPNLTDYAKCLLKQISDYKSIR